MEGSKVTGIQWGFSALPLKCRDFPSFSESFNNITACKWWNPYIHYNCAFRNTLLIGFEYLTMKFFTKWCPLWMTESFEDVSFIHNHDPLTLYQFTCLPVQCSKKVFSTTFPVFCCPCPNFLETCCRHQSQNECGLSVWTCNIWSL